MLLYIRICIGLIGWKGSCVGGKVSRENKRVEELDNVRCVRACVHLFCQSTGFQKKHKHSIGTHVPRQVNV